MFLKTGMRLNRDRDTEQQNLAAARDPEGLKVSLNLDFLGEVWLCHSALLLNTSPFLGCI